eukprot:scaffold1401_cov330-Pavlova_lutheri.AAC.110
MEVSSEKTLRSARPQGVRTGRGRGARAVAPDRRGSPSSGWLWGSGSRGITRRSSSVNVPILNGGEGSSDKRL